MLIRNLNEFGVWTKYDQKNQNGGEFYVHYVGTRVNE